MNNDPNQLLRGPAVYAWLALIFIITLAAAFGVTTQHGQTTGAILVAIATFIGVWVAIATLSRLTSEKKKTLSVMTTTSALCACLGLLSIHAQTIRQIFSDIDIKTVIIVLTLAFTALLTFFIFRYNS